MLAQNTWKASETEAATLGGHLATINDATENNWVYSTFSKFGGINRGLWIGLNDAAQEGKYVWASGENVPYLNWGSGEPANQNGLDDYVHIFWPGDARAPGWNDAEDANNFANIPLNGVVETSCNNNTNAALTDGLMAYYPFNGNANDESGNGNNGTVAGPQLTNDRKGNPSSAYSFTTIGNKITAPDSTKLNFGTGAFSITVWVNSTQTGVGKRIITKRNQTTSGSWYSLAINNNKAWLELSAGTSLSSTKTINDGNWHFVTAIRDAVNKKYSLYVDGIFDVTMPDSGLSLDSAVSSPLQIGAFYNESYDSGTFKGAIDDIRIYNRALSANEVTELYNNTAVTPPVVQSPTISGVSPLIANLNEPTIFTVTGSGLTSGMGFSVGDCVSSNIEVGTGSSTQRTFQCTPDSTGGAGLKAGLVKNAPGGTTLYSFNVQVQANSVKNTPIAYVNVNSNDIYRGDVLRVYFNTTVPPNVTEQYDVYFQIQWGDTALYDAGNGNLSPKIRPLLKNFTIPKLNDWFEHTTNQSFYYIFPDNAPKEDYILTLFLVNQDREVVSSNSTVVSYHPEKPFVSNTKSSARIAKTETNISAIVGKANRTAEECTLGGIKTSQEGFVNLSKAAERAMLILQFGSKFLTKADTSLLSKFNKNAQGSWNLLKSGQKLCEDSNKVEGFIDTYLNERDSLGADKASTLMAIRLLDKLMHQAPGGDLLYSGFNIEDLVDGIKTVYTYARRTGEAGCISDNSCSVNFIYTNAGLFSWFRTTKTLEVYTTPVFTYNVPSGYIESDSPRTFVTDKDIKEQAEWTFLGKTTTDHGTLPTVNLTRGLYLVKAVQKDDNGNDIAVYRGSVHVTYGGVRKLSIDSDDKTIVNDD